MPRGLVFSDQFGPKPKDFVIEGVKLLLREDPGRTDALLPGVNSLQAFFELGCRNRSNPIERFSGKFVSMAEQHEIVSGEQGLPCGIAQRIAMGDRPHVEIVGQDQPPIPEMPTEHLGHEKRRKRARKAAGVEQGIERVADHLKVHFADEVFEGEPLPALELLSGSLNRRQLMMGIDSGSRVAGKMLAAARDSGGAQGRVEGAGVSGHLVRVAAETPVSKTVFKIAFERDVENGTKIEVQAKKPQHPTSQISMPGDLCGRAPLDELAGTGRFAADLPQPGHATALLVDAEQGRVFRDFKQARDERAQLPGAPDIASKEDESSRLQVPDSASFFESQFGAVDSDDQGLSDAHASDRLSRLVTKKAYWKSNPWIFVPVLYFLQGAPYFVVNAISIIIFKRLGVPNDTLLFWLSMIAWPWTLKMFWSPVVDSVSTKTRWVLATQALNVLCMLLFSISLQASDPWSTSLLVLAFAALVSATHDIASDGFYLIALNHQQRSFFVGLSSTAYRLSRIFVTGGLVWLAGHWESGGMPLVDTWSKVLQIAALAYLLAMGIFFVSRPRPEEDSPSRVQRIEWGVFRDYFRQPRLAVIVSFILFYRFGESMVGALSAPFLLDPRASGGMGLSTEQVGQMVGVVGVVALTLGGMMGGVVLSRWGLKRCLRPMLVAMYLPNLFYLWAAWVKPSVWALYGVVFVDQFGYGFGFSAYLVFLMFIAQTTRFKTAHYAISSALMAAGATLASALSGFLQSGLQRSLGVDWGYSSFFALTFLVCLPGIALVGRLPLEHEPNA